MGWARYAHSMRVFVMNSGLFFIRPTHASVALLHQVIHRLNTENGWDQAIFNEARILKIPTLLLSIGNYLQQARMARARSFSPRHAP
jgi:hypothetical protein